MKHTAVGLLLFLVVIGYSSAQQSLHRAGGLLFQDPRLVAGMAEVTAVSVLPGAACADSVDAVDLSSQMPPVGNQGSQGSCVAWSVGYYHWSHTQYKDYGWDLSQTSHQISAAFIYNQINGGADVGAYFEDAIKLICEQGACMMSDFAYSQSDYTTWPSESAFARAITYRGDGQYYIDVSTDAGINAVKQRLNNGYTSVLGISVYSNFDYIQNFNYTYCVADKYGTNRGGHGVCIVGYDDTKSTADGMGAFKLVNSWGTGWGLSGYWWMSYYAVKTVSAGLSQGYAYFATDRARYQPTLLARLRITHNARDRVAIRLGVGRSSSALWSRDFREFDIYGYSITDRAFPLSNVVFDLSDGAQYFANGSTDSAFLRCLDRRSDSKTGSIRYFSSEYSPWGTTGIASDTPVAIPDYNVAVFSRTRVPLTMHDVGCARILVPAGTVDSGTTMTPACSVYNFGTYTETYQVRMRIGSYNQAVAVSGQAPGARICVTFPAWTAGARGVFGVSCSTELAGDARTANDKQSGSVAVQVQDVGCTALLAPTGRLDSGTAVTPACSVYNYGSALASYLVRMKIGGTYDRTANVANHAPGTSLLVPFPVWIAESLGPTAVICSTELSGDLVSGNDRIPGLVTVTRPVIRDVGCTRILAPVGAVDSGTVVVPACSVCNYGNTTEEYQVRMKIGAYNHTASVTGHVPGERLLVEFPSWTAGTRSLYAITCSTELGGDRQATNDKKSGVVTVQVTDVSCVKLLSPSGVVDSGTAVVPACSVRNYGSTTPSSYTVRMRIGDNYNQTAAVTNHSAGSRVYVVFPVWVAGPVGGPFEVSCSTELVGDMRTSNDRQTGMVQVRLTDMAALSIVVPADTADSGAVVIPQALVANRGTEQAMFAATMTIASWSCSITDTLESGESDTLLFSACTLSTIGVIPVRCSVYVTGDMVSGNDIVQDSVVVISHAVSLEERLVADPSRRFGLQMVPDPMVDRVRISYSLTVSGHVRVSIYDAAGKVVRELVNAAQGSGRYELIWNRDDRAGRRLSAGIYFCRLESAGRMQRRKLVAQR